MIKFEAYNSKTINHKTMKKIILSLLLTNLSVFVFGQSVMITPSSMQKSSTGALDDLLLTKFSSTESSYIIGRNASGSATSPTATLNGSYLLFMGGRGYTGTGFTGVSSSSISFRATQSWATNANGSSILFSTTQNGTTQRIDRMIINHNGNVGIGTASPNTKLDINGDFALTKKLIVSGNGGHSNLDREGASVITIADPTLPAPNSGGGETISGIAGGVDGVVVHLYPRQGTSFTIENEGTTSVATNRILTHTAVNVTIFNNGGCTLIYDGTLQRWRVIGIAN